MRNLKRVLSLALALVMVLGMMVITTSAADYTDAEEIKYEEAVEVMTALGILNGNPDGSFNPKGTLTRQEAAKILAFVVMGTEADEYLTGSTAPFDDVAADKWSAKYIAYCKNLGIIDGVGNNKFNPTGTLKVAEFAKMLLVAADIKGEYTGSNWANNVKDAVAKTEMAKTDIKISLAEITREEACELALAAMKSGGSTTTYYYVVDKAVTEINATTAAAAHGKFDNVSDAYVLASIMNSAVANSVKVLTDDVSAGTLLKDTHGWNYNTTAISDKFGRPAVSYDNGKTGEKKVELLFPAEADCTYVVTGKNDTTLAQIAEKLELEVNGASMDAAVKGDTVELFLDATGKIYDAVKLHTELVQVSKVVKTKDEDAKYTYVVSLKGTATTYTDVQLIGFDVETMGKDAYITMVKGDGVAIVAVAEYITGKQTATGSDYIKVDGEKKSYVPGAVSGVNYADTYMFFVDANGLIIGNKKVVETEAKADTNVFYIKEGKFVKGDSWTESVAKISVEYLDGTKGVLDMAITTKATDPGKKFINKDTELVTDNDLVGAGFYTYTLNDAGEVATLAAVGTDHTADKATHVYLANTKAVSFLKGKANIVWNGVTFFADEETTVNFINPTGNVTVTGYANFLDKAFTASASVRALMEFDGDEVVAIYVFGDAFAPVAAPGVLGVYISTGDTTYDAAQDAYFTEVVYNVKGEDVTYTIAGSSVASDVKGFADIVVTDGIAALTPAVVISEDVEKVTATYLVIDGAPVPFASEVAYYDVTNVAKNGVVADDEVVVGDVIHYATNLDGEITAVYTTYAAQEDGPVAVYNSTYLTEVCNFAYDIQDTRDRFAAGQVSLVQYTATTNANGMRYVLAHESNAEWASDTLYEGYPRVAGETYIMTTNFDYVSWGEGNYTYSIFGADGELYGTGTIYYGG